MNRRGSANAILMVGLLCSGLSAAQTGVSAPGVENPVPSVSDLRNDVTRFDLSLDAMRQMTTLPRSLVLLFSDPDFRDRRLSDDWRDYILPPDHLLSIATQRERIMHEIDRGEMAAAAGHFAVMQAYARTEARTAPILLQYWQRVGAHPPNWQPYVDMLRANGLEPSFIENFASLERTFKLQISQGLFTDAMTVTWPKLLDIHGRGARLDSKSLEALNVPDKGLYPLSRTGDCSPPAAATSGASTVKIDPSRTATPAIYPDGPRRRQEEGNALVGLMVTPQGCVRVASVFGSTGYEELDRAAVTQGLALRFLPAEHDGVAIEHVAILPMNYKLPSSN
jgi:TonB family protein